MTINRRELLTGIGGVAAAAALRPFAYSLGATAELPGPRVTFPRKDDFTIEEGYTYLNAAYTHPIPRVSVEAARRAVEGRGWLRVPPADRVTPNPRALFAQLINAKPTEIAYVSSTTEGENLAGCTSRVRSCTSWS
jgi:selenocysteine lyase/cysteine desulfurase